MFDSLFDYGDLKVFAIALVGAMAYWIASGAARADYKALHVLLGVALFSAVGAAVYSAFSIFVYDDLFIGAIVSFVIVTPLAYIWRRWGADWVFPYLQKYRITNTSFGPSRAWDSFHSDADGRGINYLRVHLTNGDELDSDLVLLHDKWEKKKLDFNPGIITDAEGNVVLVVTKIRRKGATEHEENNPVDQEKGTEFTYIPATNITKIRAYIDKP